MHHKYNSSRPVLTQQENTHTGNSIMRKYVPPYKYLYRQYTYESSILLNIIKSY